MTERNHKDCRAEPCMTPDYHKRFKERFKTFNWEHGTQYEGCLDAGPEEVLAFFDNVVAEAKHNGCYCKELVGSLQEQARAEERTALIKVVEELMHSASMEAMKGDGDTLYLAVKSHQFPQEADFRLVPSQALDAVLAHLRTGEETDVECSCEELEDEPRPICRHHGWIQKAFLKETEKGGSSFSGRVNFGKPRLSNPVRPWPKEISPQPQDSIREETTKIPNPAYEMYQAYLKDTAQEEDGIREGCCEKCAAQDYSKTSKKTEYFCSQPTCKCHSPREEGGEPCKDRGSGGECEEDLNGFCYFCRQCMLPAPTEEKPNQ